ncbi:MAG: CoA-binding protein [Gemmatimonadetes bacterium]|nr:CoA-binding protein [Gemmatimonadota bacterium]
MTQHLALASVLATSSDPHNPGPDQIRRILETTRKIAVVGMSRDPAKAARRVPSYLAAKGYDVIPVNPFAERILGKPARKRLQDVDEPVDLVLIFRPSDQAGAVVDAAARRPESPVIWLQEGIRADEAAARARAARRIVVQDLCIYKAHRESGLGAA